MTAKLSLHVNMDRSPHHLLAPNLVYQGVKATSDPGPLNKIGENPQEQRRSRSRNESVTEREDNDGSSSNCNDKTESDLDSELDDLAIRVDPPDLLPGQRSRLDSLASRNCSVAEAQAQAFSKLQEELMNAKETLQLKDEQVEQLSRVREEVDREITELTASLFEEANSMVQEANIKRIAAERRLREASGKIDALQAEIGALKMLVLTSTPSMPVPRDTNNTKKPSILRKSKSSLRLSIQGHHRTHSLQGPITAADLGVPPSANGTSPNTNGSPTPSPTTESKEVDTLLLHNFQSWRETPSLAVDNPFTQRIFREDIQPCLSFTNGELSLQLQSSIERNHLCIEPISIKATVPRRCALSEQQRPCHYRIRLAECENWHSICAPVRNRIAAVCDFYTYLRYIKQGIVKNDVQKNYWEIIRLRKEMALAKLGLV